MKKSCFFSVIISITLIIGIGLYLLKRYSPEIKKFGKDKIIQMSLKDLNEKIDKLQTSNYNDSLKLFLRTQVKAVEDSSFKESMNRFSSLSQQVKYFIKDGSIDSVEFKALKNMAIYNE